MIPASPWLAGGGDLTHVWQPMTPDTHRIPRALGWLACGFVISIAGCTTPGNGLPTGSRVVGGGLSVDYRAPENGTVVLREETTRRMVATQTLSEGDPFTFPDVTMHHEALTKLFGDPMPTNLVFTLYFVPGPKETP